MFSLYFSIIILLKTEKSTALYPEHLDFQNIGDVYLSNEKYNILKPTIHKVTDHFKEFMLRKNAAIERTFLDDNGFRHSWSGFDAGSLRKANDKTFDEKAVTTKSPAEPGDKNGPAKTEDKNGPAKIEDKNSPAKTEGKSGPARTEDTSSPAKEDIKPAGGRTMAKVTFFCPFFGVINMNAFVD